MRLKPVLFSAYQVTRFMRINHADETGFRPFNLNLTCGLRPRLAARFTLKRANKFDTNDVRPRPHRPPRLVFRFVTLKVSRVPFYIAGEVWWNIAWKWWKWRSEKGRWPFILSITGDQWFFTSILYDFKFETRIYMDFDCFNLLNSISLRIKGVVGSVDYLWNWFL